MNKSHCDDCAKEFNTRNMIPVEELKWNVTSANRGESAILCTQCYNKHESKTYTYNHPTGDIIFQSWDHYNRFLVHENKVNKRQIKSNKDKSQSKEELPTPAEIKVKVNNMDEFIKTWDVLYPKK